MNSFDDLFQKATGNPAPYPYQRRFATGAQLPQLPQLLSVPTGVGKTATAVLGWLWRRKFADASIRKTTPRRLVFCLPMRTLVEQTQAECIKWLTNLKRADNVGVHILMGGEDLTDWDTHPERDAIIIGTQDMLLSRALNRGYGMSRYRWPMHFGLLNNDCLWVLDETQLMGVGLTTSCQLAGLRQKLGTHGNCQTLWMSATLNSDALNTVDHPKPDPKSCGLTLDDDDLANERVNKLLTATKPLSTAKTVLNPETAKKGYEASLAEEITSKHQAGTLTLVVINNVGRAQKIFTSLQKLTGDNATNVKLIHSRFRPFDRRETQEKALDESSISVDGFGRIVIATQAIEAGVDISATTLFTELAPWSSLVQRFGRCNRRGICGQDNHAAANVYTIDFDTSDAKKAKSLSLPYEVDSLNAARQQLTQLTDVGPQSLDGIVVEEPQPIVHVLRRKDLIDLFDTTADLSGNDLDVSRYIRDSDDTDVQVYWREWDNKASRTLPMTMPDGTTTPGPDRDELCSVPVGQMKTFADKLKKTIPATVWDPLTNEWRTVGKNDIRPGMVILLHTAVGGYNKDLGWTAESKHKPVQPVAVPSDDGPEFMGGDDTAGGKNEPLELTQHLVDVAFCAEQLQQAMNDKNIPWDTVLTAARWHDVGKSHEAFQNAMLDASAIPSEIGDGQLWAKSGTSGKPYYRVRISQVERPVQLPGHHSEKEAVTEAATAVAQEPRYKSRIGFRHELASTMAWLKHNQFADTPDVNLVAYLIAAHHGKVRLSIRSMPNESGPRDSSLRFARGIHEGDSLPGVDLGNGQSSSPVDSIKLDLMSLGESESGPSWLARMLELRQQHGPFQLALLETFVRIADWRGSAEPECGGVV